MPPCWISLVLQVVFSEVVLGGSPLRDSHYYLNGQADPDKDPDAVVSPEGFICSNITRECFCAGQNCTLLPTVVLRTNITVLTINKASAIQVIQPHAFAFNPDLEILEIIQSKVNEVSTFAFSELTRLRVLNLAFNEISVLNPDVFQGLVLLEELILMKNNIKSFDNLIPAIVPSILPSLTVLHLSGNSLKTINESTFVPMTGSKVDFIHLVRCELNYIHPKAFEPLSSLETLLIKSNDQLNESNLAKVFENFRGSNLSMLDISIIPFHGVPTHLLQILSETNVKSLYLTSIPITDIRKKSFPKMPNLEFLSLDYNHVQTIEDGSLASLVNLKTLRMAKNLLTSFPPAILIPHLEVLDLSGYGKQLIRLELRDFTFSKMVRLKSLVLSFKSLETLSKNTFYGLASLALLNVRKCGISSIEDGAFLHLTSLRSLDISENPLFELGVVSEKLFYGLQSTLETLTLQDAGFAGGTDRFWANLDNVQTLDLKNNSLSSVAGIVRNLKHLRRFFVSKNNIHDWNKPVMADNSSLETLDLSHNSLSVVTAAMLKDFDSVLNLNVSQNPFQCSCSLLGFGRWLNTTNTTVAFYKRSSIKKQDSLVCNIPAEYARMPIKEVTQLLGKKCNVVIQAKLVFILGFLAVLLVICFSTVVSLYLFRRKLRKYWWSKNDSHNKFLYDAFVSYSANDADWVFNFLLPHLENSASNMRLCVYDRDFIAGEAITDCILDSIKNSRRIVLVVSKNFIKSPWCKLETDLAHHILLDENRDGLLLIRLGQLDLKEVHTHLRYLLTTRLYLAWTSDPQEQKEFWNKLKRALEFNNKTPKIKAKERSSQV